MHSIKKAKDREQLASSTELLIECWRASAFRKTVYSSAAVDFGWFYCMAAKATINSIEKASCVAITLPRLAYSCALIPSDNFDDYVQVTSYRHHS